MSTKIPLEPATNPNMTYARMKREIRILMEEEGGKLLMADNPGAKHPTLGFIWFKDVKGVELTKIWEIPLWQAGQEFGKGLLMDRQAFAREMRGEYH